MSLDVYLHGERIGTLYPGARGAPRRRNEYSFAYTRELFEKVEPGTPLLSYSMPVRPEPFEPDETRPYIEGLLPEGRRRGRIAAELDIDPDDGYSLIAALGRDCPGAVAFMPKGRAPERRRPEELAWLDEDDLEEVVGEEPEWLVDPNDERRMRFALPGERHKLALVYDERGDRWAWPEPGVPSTHIVKPQSDACDTFAVNEMACSLAMREMGLPVAHAELRTIAGRPCLVSKRFDRWGKWPQVDRMHQESLAQALGYAPDDLEGEGPGYAESCELLKAIGEEDSIEALFALSYCRFLIGNGDEVHGMSSAVLYTEQGPILAPVFDIASTAAYEDAAELGTVDELVERNSCLVSLAPIGIECGYALQPAVMLAVETIAGLCKSLGAVARRAQTEGWYEPLIDQILQRVIDRLKSFREEVEILKPPSLG